MAVVIKRIDEDNFLVEVENGLIKQPFHKSQYADLLKYVSNYIKKIPFETMTEQMFPKIKEFEGILPHITKSKKKEKIIILNQETLF